MAQTIFEEMGGTYTQIGDYLLPDLELPEEEQQPIGGQRHRRYLKEHRRAAERNSLIMILSSYNGRTGQGEIPAAIFYLHLRKLNN